MNGVIWSTTIKRMFGGLGPVAALRAGCSCACNAGIAAFVAKNCLLVTVRSFGSEIVYIFSELLLYRLQRPALRHRHPPQHEDELGRANDRVDSERPRGAQRPIQNREGVR